MKAIIVYFSPSGGTDTVAGQFAVALGPRCERVDKVNLARNESYWESGAFRSNLYRMVDECDLLCVGGPVYAHHLHYNMTDFIRGLIPTTRRQAAVAFVTYGGINSGAALHEAEQLLKARGRTVIAGLKVNSEHTLTKGIPLDYNRGLPGQTAVPLIDEIVERAVTVDLGRVSTRDFLQYQRFAVRLRSRLLIGEKFWHRYLYPRRAFDDRRCNGCGVCARMCAVRRIEMVEGRPRVKDDARACVHCGSCVFSCKPGATRFDADMAKWVRLFRHAAAGKGPLPSNEHPKTAAYFARLTSAPGASRRRSSPRSPR